MPLYEYRCTKCRHRFEKIEKVSGPHARKCPKCGGVVEQLMAAPAIQFKGSGWYVTDYARKTSGADSAKSGEPGEKPAAKETKESKEPAAKESKKAPAKQK